jgi:hypothetical protein
LPSAFEAEYYGPGGFHDFQHTFASVVTQLRTTKADTKTRKLNRQEGTTDVRPFSLSQNRKLHDSEFISLVMQEGRRW